MIRCQSYLCCHHEIHPNKQQRKGDTDMESKTTFNPVNLPVSHIISDTTPSLLAHRDTLNNVASTLALLQELNLSRNLPASAENGLYLVQATLIDAVKYVSDALEVET